MEKAPKQPVSLAKKTEERIINAFSEERATLLWIVESLDMTRMDLLKKKKTYNKEAWLAVTDSFRNSPYCPFVKAAPGTYSFTAWLEWSGVEPLMQVVQDGGEVAEFPVKLVSLILYYASYALSVTRYQNVSAYHTTVKQTLQELKNQKDRSLRIAILSRRNRGKAVHNLFHRLYGNVGEGVPAGEMGYVPAQFFFHTWKSVHIDCSTFTLWRAMPEFYWISRYTWTTQRKLAALSTVSLMNSNHTQRAYVMSIQSLESFTVQCKEGDHTINDMSDLLGVAHPLKDTLAIALMLKTLILRRVKSLRHFPQKDSVPRLDHVHLEGIKSGGSEALEITPFLQMLGNRDDTIRVGQKNVTIGFPKDFTLINCDGVDPMSSHWLTVGDRCESLTLGHHTMYELPNVKPNIKPIEKLGLVDIHIVPGTLTSAETVSEFIGTLNPLALELNNVRPLTSETLGVVMQGAQRMTHCSLINLGVYDLSWGLKDKNALTSLTVSDLSVDRFRIPYKELQSLTEQHGLLSPSKNAPLPLTPDSAGALRDLQRIQDVKRMLQFEKTATATETETSKHAEMLPVPEAVVDGDATSVATTIDSLLAYGRPLGTIGRPDNLVLPPWLPSKERWMSYPEEKRNKWLRNWAAWSSEIDTWFCGPDTSEGVLFEPAKGVIFVKRTRTDRDGIPFCDFHWKPDPGMPFYNEEISSLFTYVIGSSVDMNLVLIRRARFLGVDMGETPATRLVYSLGTRPPRDAKGRHHQVVIENFTKSADGNTGTGHIYYVDHRHGIKFFMAYFTARDRNDAVFSFSLEGLVAFFSLQMVVDLLNTPYDVTVRDATTMEREMFIQPTLSFEAGRTAKEREKYLREIMVGLMRLITEEPYSPDEVNPLLVLSVEHSANRATLSDMLVHGYLLGVGLNHFVEDYQNRDKIGNRPFYDHLVSVVRQYVGPVLSWITAGLPVQSELVALAYEREEAEEYEEGKESELIQVTGDTLQDAFEGISNQLYDFYQEEEDLGKGVLVLFQSNEFTELIILMIEAREDYNGWLADGANPKTYDTRYRVFKLLDDIVDFEDRIRKLAVVTPASNVPMTQGLSSMVKILHFISKTFADLRAPLNRVSRDWTDEELKDPTFEKGYYSGPANDRVYNQDLIAKHYFSVYSLKRVAEMMAEAYTQSEDAMDLLLALDAMVDEVEATPQKRAQPSPGEISLQSPKSSEVKRVKLVKRSAVTPSPEKEIDDVLILSDDVGVATFVQSPEQLKEKEEARIFEGASPEYTKKRSPVVLDVSSTKDGTPPQTPVKRIIKPKKKKPAPAPVVVIDLERQAEEELQAIEEEQKRLERQRKEAQERVEALQREKRRRERREREKEKEKGKKKEIIELDELIQCDWCDSTDDSGSASFLQCSRCEARFYCSAECQRDHWTQGGHREECNNSSSSKLSTK